MAAKPAGPRAGARRLPWPPKTIALVFVVVGLLGLYQVGQIVSFTTTSGGSKGDRGKGEAAKAPVPVFLKFHKTGGTSVAATLARAMYCGDRDFKTWRERLEDDNRDGRETLNGRSGSVVEAIAFSLLRRPLKKLCGNYDGHWATLTYRHFGARGMRWCAGSRVPFFPTRRAVLVTLLRHPTSRFVSRLYYELGGRSDLLLSEPFANDPSSWTVADMMHMERITCDACQKINNGHCLWRGGLCDAPQEYLVVLSRFGSRGPRGVLDRKEQKDTRLIDTARREALQNLRTDFDVVGVLEELHAFFAALAVSLQWPLEALLYAARKQHATTTTPKTTSSPQCVQTAGVEDDIRTMRPTQRRDERLRKRDDARMFKEKNASVEWSGTFPLLGWNSPRKGALSAAVQAYVVARNADDLALWDEARTLARRRARPDVVAKFDVLQTAYADGLVRNAHGFYAFCDWRAKNPDDPRNLECRRCAETMDSRRCRLTGSVDTTTNATGLLVPVAVETTCRYDASLSSSSSSDSSIRVAYLADDEEERMDDEQPSAAKDHSEVGERRQQSTVRLQRR